MAYEQNPDTMAELLQALDDVRDAARRVDHERNLAIERPAPAGTTEPPHTAGDEPDFS
jgi:hypothetical protein